MEKAVGVTLPYKRTCRQFIDNSYASGGKARYLTHKDFADSPEQCVRPFLLIQKDLQILFDYVEPSDLNLNCYSYRIHELLTRTCIEIEANCKAILTENGYKKKGQFSMSDYMMINTSHHLSSYEVGLPLWNGNHKISKPFNNWKSKEPLVWYQAYNALKHNRHKEFYKASFINLIDAICGLVALLSAQFWTEDYMPAANYLSLESGANDKMEPAIGGYFRVKFPNDWAVEEMYSFSYENIEEPNFYVQKYDYAVIN